MRGKRPMASGRYLCPEGRAKAFKLAVLEIALSGLQKISIAEQLMEPWYLANT